MSSLRAIWYVLFWLGGKNAPLRNSSLEIDRATTFSFATRFRHVLDKNMKIGLKSAIIFAYVSMFLCVVRKSSKIGQNRKNCHEIKLEAQFPSKHDYYDRIHQITLFCKRNLQTVAISLLFSRKKIESREWAILTVFDSVSPGKLSPSPAFLKNFIETL